VNPSEPLAPAEDDRRDDDRQLVDDARVERLPDHVGADARQVCDNPPP
jgi:hypothetical protein